MSNTFIQPGEHLTLTAPAGGVESGKPYLIGSLFVVALISALEGEPFSAATRGVHGLPKAAVACVEGAPAYFKDGAITSVATDADLVGVFTADAAAPATSVPVLIGQHVVA